MPPTNLITELCHQWYGFSLAGFPCPVRRGWIRREIDPNLFRIYSDSDFLLLHPPKISPRWDKTIPYITGAFRRNAVTAIITSGGSATFKTLIIDWSERLSKDGRSQHLDGRPPGKFISKRNYATLLERISVTIDNRFGLDAVPPFYILLCTSTSLFRIMQSVSSRPHFIRSKRWKINK